MAQGKPNKQELAFKLRQLESALQAVRGIPGMSETVAHFKAKIASTKSELAEMRPLGARIDAARAALDRAERRAVQAKEALATAQRAVELSEKEVASYKDGVLKLEAMVVNDAEEGDMTPKIQQLAR